MPMWTCDFVGCQRPAVRTQGQCILCNRHLCSEHLQPAFHDCPKWEDGSVYDPAARKAEQEELSRLIQQVNTAALAARASHLRHGIPCSIPDLQYDRATRSSVMGGMNYHVEIQFEDGVVWLARIRRFNATSPPPALRDYIMQSEVATLGFLEQTGVPAPKVYDFALEHESNPVGVGYILLEKMPGKPLRWSIATTEQRRTVMSQVADVLIELRKYPFYLMGSLHSLDGHSETHIGPFASESLTVFTDSKMKTIGPCSSLAEFRSASLRLILNLIVCDEIYTQQAVDAYLIHRFLLDVVPSVLPSSPQDDKEFFLKHADDKGDHILVDDDYNITGIIDWEWAYATSKALAFNSPIAFLPVAEFYDGVNGLGNDEIAFIHLLEEKGRSDLAGFVREGRLQHRFEFCSHYDLADWDGFLGLFLGLRNALCIDEGLDWESWKTVALERYQDDKALQLLLSREDPSDRSNTVSKCKS